MTQDTKNKIAIEFLENRWLFLCICIAIVGSLIFFGCQSTIQSILDPSIKITRNQLQLEIDTFLTTAEQRMLELDNQDRIRQLLFERALLIAETGTINPFAVITTIGSVLGLGAVADNIKKRKIIHKNNIIS